MENEAKSFIHAFKQFVVFNKFSTMKLIKLNLFMNLILSLLIGNDADEILTTVMNRLDGIDRTMKIQLIQDQKGKPTKEQIFNSWTHYSESSEIRKMVKIQIEKPRDLKGTCFWIHENNNGKSQKWMTMPVSGKLKDITDKPEQKGEFDFSELEITQKDIEDHSNELVGEEEVNNRTTIIIESTEFKESGKIKIVKKIWVDKANYFIHKVVYRNTKDRIVKNIELSNLMEIDDISLFTRVKIQNFRKKQNIEITFSDISFKPITNLELFNPKPLK